MELLDGVENPLHRLRGNAVVIAVNDIGKPSSGRRRQVGGYPFIVAIGKPLLILLIHYIMLSAKLQNAQADESRASSQGQKAHSSPEGENGFFCKWTNN